MTITRLSAALALAVLSHAMPSMAAEPIRIGFNSDLSASPSAQSSQHALLGFDAAIADINKQGGVLGRPLELVVRDDVAQPPKAIQNMSDLIDGEKVVAVMGPTNSGNALAWKHIPNARKIPVITVLGTATGITQPMAPGADNYMFRLSAVDREQVVAILTYAAKNPATKKIAVFVETTGYGQGGLKDIEELKGLYGLAPVIVDKFNVSDTDMTSQLNKMKAAGVDTIIMWGQGTPMGHVLRSMEKIDYFPIVLTSWASDNKSFIDAAGPKLGNIPIFLRTIAPDYTPRQQQLYERVKDKITAPSVFWATCQGYDAMKLLALAMQQAGTTDGDAVRKALENLKGIYEGYSKTYDKPFSAANHEGIAGPDFVWTRWVDGKLTRYSDAVIAGLKPADFKRP
ncbi:ABC transporter substrate-binding protein [Bradyrhizobium sp. 2TAF24]|uniref:ABC transporter substrate-binding protein n=1 Tax=Bradyrhizobium sp. 2TAF24 TaxID=3233011 RepID=UPI003F8E8645